MKKLLFLLLLVVASSAISQAQTNGSQGVTDGIVTRAVIIEGDTVPLFWIPTVKIFGPIIFKSKVQMIEFSRLVKHIKKVYPYAKLIAHKVNAYNTYLNTIKSDNKRDKEVKRLEKEVRSQFEGELTKLTYTQGKILLKLIYRETSSTTYNLIKDFRGNLTAFFWQSLGSFFGYNLKVTYNPDGLDRDIETIVVMIENGTI